jgi:NAD(P)-dependent dehydrogenase (short-subunit alcohol dehydrogenase family)
VSPALDTLSGRVAVITGAASGIGRATAQLFAERGALVVVADIVEKQAEATVDLIRRGGGTAAPFTVDVSDEEEVAAMVGHTVTLFGSIDILHNNAAALDPGTLGQDRDVVTMAVDLWDRTMAVTLRGAMLGCKYALPHMLERGAGVILNTTSTAGLTGDLSRPAYGSAKAGVVSFTRYVATLYGRRGIRCNAIAPGLILSPPALAALTPEQLDTARHNRLVPRHGRPEDVAALAAFLASDEAGFITGQVINVDGGALAHSPGYSDQLRLSGDSHY